MVELDLLRNNFLEEQSNYQQAFSEIEDLIIKIERKVKFGLGIFDRKRKLQQKVFELNGMLSTVASDLLQFMNAIKEDNPTGYEYDIHHGFAYQYYDMSVNLRKRCGELSFNLQNLV